MLEDERGYIDYDEEGSGPTIGWCLVMQMPVRRVSIGSCAPATTSDYSPLSAA